MRQLITPNPHIPCQPGWCLQYVRQAFGLPARYGTATAAWEASGSKHRDRNFPKGVWFPVWYGLHREPAGHVVLVAPDGSCYSTSDNSTTPHHHPDLADLESFYAGWGWPLTYRGWTEDVAGYPVITPGGLAAMGTITPLSEEDDVMAIFNSLEEFKKAVSDAVQESHTVTRASVVKTLTENTEAQHIETRKQVIGMTQAQSDVTRGYLADRIKESSPQEIAALVPQELAQQVVDALSARLAGGSK